MLDRFLALARSLSPLGENFFQKIGKVEKPSLYLLYIIAFLCRGSCRSHPQPR